MGEIEAPNEKITRVKVSSYVWVIVILFQLVLMFVAIVFIPLLSLLEQLFPLVGDFCQSNLNLQRKLISS